MIKNKVLFIFVFFLFFIPCVCFASDDGISTTSLTTSDDFSTYEEDGVTYKEISYTANLTSAVYTGSFIYSDEFLEENDIEYYSFWVADDGSIYMISTKYSVLLLAFNSGYFYRCCTVDSSYSSGYGYCYFYKYDTDTCSFSFLSSSRSFKYGLTPNSFLICFNGSVSVITGLADTSSNYTSALSYCQSYNVYSIYEFYFSFNADYSFISYIDGYLTIDLDILYPSYTYSSSSDTLGVDISVYSYDYFNFYLYYDDIYYTVPYSVFKDDIVYFSDYGYCLFFDVLSYLETIGVDYSADDKIYYSFSFSGVFLCDYDLYYTSNGSTPSSSAYYYTYYSYDYAGSFTCGTDVIISDDGEEEEYTYTDKVLDEQTNIMNEELETSKGILSAITDILNFLNPFSDSFFVYTLIDLLVDAITSLFVPSDDFFSEWFTNLNDTFSDQFGILYYPVSVIIEFFEDLDDCLVSSEPVISFNDFSISLFGHDYVVVSAFSYNLNDLLVSDSINTVHTYSLFFINIIMTIWLIGFAAKIFVEIFGGSDTPIDAVISGISNRTDPSTTVGVVKGKKD